MRFYTKEWYELMQRQDYTLCMRQIPDKEYSTKEIRAFFEKKLKSEIARDRREYNTPPCFLDVSDQLKPENFDPEGWLLFPNGEEGEPRHPTSPEEVSEQLEREKKEAEDAFANRPPFDSSESEKVFREGYMARLRYCDRSFPAWVCRQVDRRLLALDLLPKSVYQRLKIEEKENRKAFRKIERAAKKELDRQHIPEQIAEAFSFHDSSLLSLRKQGRNYEMLLRKDGGWFGDEDGVTPYIKVVFTDAVLIEREKGLKPRTRTDADGAICSKCIFLYHEIYSVENGYEVHMLFAVDGWSNLAYLTVRCSEIGFEDNIVLTE